MGKNCILSTCTVLNGLWFPLNGFKCLVILILYKSCHFWMKTYIYKHKGRGPKAATGQAQEGKTGADSCPRAGHGSGSEETSQPRVFLFIWLVFIT